MYLLVELTLGSVGILAIEPLVFVLMVDSVVNDEVVETMPSDIKLRRPSASIYCDVTTLNRSNTIIILL